MVKLDNINYSSFTQKIGSDFAYAIILCAE